MKEYFIGILLVLSIALCASCQLVPKQNQESSLEVSDSKVRTIETTQDQSGGKAKEIDEIITNNNSGERWWVWLLVGFLIPMPRVIKWFF